MSPETTKSAAHFPLLNLIAKHQIEVATSFFLKK